MAAGVPVDIQKLHRQIWDARDRRGLVKIYQKAFARHVGVTVYTMSRLMRQLSEEGRIKKVGARYRNVGIYKVNDPVEWETNGLEAP